MCIDISFSISIILNIILLICLLYSYSNKSSSKLDYSEFEDVLKTIMFVIDTMLESSWKNELYLRIDKYKNNNPNSQNILNNEIKKETLSFVQEKLKEVVLLFNPILRKKIKKHFTDDLLIHFITDYLINGLNDKG